MQARTIVKAGPSNTHREMLLGLYIYCRLPEGNAKMIQCIACREWFHQHCETVPQTVGQDVIQSGSAVHVMHNFVKLQALYIDITITFVKFFFLSWRAELIECSVCNHSTSFHAVQTVQPAFKLGLL